MSVSIMRLVGDLCLVYFSGATVYSALRVSDERPSYRPMIVCFVCFAVFATGRALRAA